MAAQIKLITKDESKNIKDSIKILKKWRGKECDEWSIGCFNCEITRVIKALEQLSKM